MSTQNQGRLDVLTEIQVDHENVRDLIKRYKQCTDHDDKSTLINTIVRELAVHSEAEEVSVYNVVDAKEGDQAGKHLRDEHQALEEILYSLDYTKVDSPGFEQKFDKAAKMFLEHADEEEANYIDKLRGLLPAEENDKLARSFLQYRKTVPERPHPAAPQSGGILQKAAGLQGKLHDKIIETMTSRKFAELKYEHPAPPGFKTEKFDESLLG